MAEIAGWIAPIATMIAAMMTAANLGARITGWGFVVFTVGSIGWVIVAVTSGQSNLLYANGFLTLVNLVGIYRWLGREARLADGQTAATEESARAETAALFPVARLGAAAIEGPGGATIGHAVGAMAEYASGRIAYLVVRVGDVAGVGGTLRAVQWPELKRAGDGFRVGMTADALAARPQVDATDWPAEVTDGGR